MGPRPGRNACKCGAGEHLRAELKPNLAREIGATNENRFRREGGRSLIDIGDALSALAKVSAYLIAAVLKERS
jgi:hypothetical protein